jgi:chromosome segregation ATPase
MLTVLLGACAAGAILLAVDRHMKLARVTESEQALSSVVNSERQKAVEAQEEVVTLRKALNQTTVELQYAQQAIQADRRVRLELEAAQNELATKTDELEVANRLMDSTNNRLATVMSELNIEIESLKKKLKEQELETRAAKDEAEVLQAELAALKKDK